MSAKGINELSTFCWKQTSQSMPFQMRRPAQLGEDSILAGSNATATVLATYRF